MSKERTRTIGHILPPLTLEESLGTKDLLQVATRAWDSNLACASEALPHNHPYVKHLRDKKDQLPSTIQYTKLLLQDTVARWKSTRELPSFNQEKAMRSLLYHQYVTGKFEVVSSILAASISGTWEPDGEVNIPIAIKRINNTSREKPPHTTLPVQKIIAANVLDYFGNEPSRSFTAIQDDRVPFLFLIAQENTVKEADLKQTIDILATLYRGENIRLKGNLSKQWPGGLSISSETKEQLRQCACLILNSKVDKFAALRVKSRETRSTMVVPISGIPWLHEENAVGSHHFPEWILSGLEHEGQHFQDWRFLDGVDVNVALFEARASLKELEYQKTHSYASYHLTSTRRQLAPYIAIMQGKSIRTPVEDAYTQDVKALLPQAPLEITTKLLRHLAQGLR